MRAMLFVMCAAVLAATPAYADRTAVVCGDQSTQDLSVDGLLDEWPSDVATRIGVASDGQYALRCTWDGTAFALAVDIVDDRVIRIARGPGEQDHVVIKLAAGSNAAAVVDVYPGNAMAKPKITRPARVQAADSLQPRGFSVEVLIPSSSLKGFSTATPALALDVIFVDADKAAGGDTTRVALSASVELAERKNLLDDFLRTVRLKKKDIVIDTLVDVDPSRRGNERIVAGGTVIGVLTDQFAYVSLPAAKPGDIKKVELLPLGAKGTKVVAASVRQSGNGGARELLMLWTVSGGALQPLRVIETRKELDTNVLSVTWRIEKGKKGPELVVEPQPAVGFTAETWNEASAEDADSILVPWDAKVGGAIYTMDGQSMMRRIVPTKKRR